MPKTLKPAGWKNFRTIVHPQTKDAVRVHVSRVSFWKKLGFTLQRSK